MSVGVGGIGNCVGCAIGEAIPACPPIIMINAATAATSATLTVAAAASAATLTNEAPTTTAATLSADNSLFGCE